jgi:hypothetical protein
MTDKIQRAHAANNVLNDEVLQNALTDVQETIIKELLIAKTPEDREQKYFEWSGIDRAKKRLSMWASDVRHNKET